ncbi:MAG: hypothetical protein WAZ77_14710 [Candidatus Nitrosopolaris sp.]
MNHYISLGVVAIVGVMTLTAVAFAIPQQAFGLQTPRPQQQSRQQRKG